MAHLASELEGGPVWSIEVPLSLAKVAPVHLSFEGVPHHVAITYTRGLGNGASTVEIKREAFKTLLPLDYPFDADSRVNPVRDTLRMIKDVCRIRLNGWRGVYGPRR